MDNFTSATAFVLTIILVPWIIHGTPYFKRPDVVARRRAKAKLPGWVSLAELLFLAVSEAVLIILFFLIEGYVHWVLHPGGAFLGSTQPAFSMDFLFRFVETFAPFIVALPLGMILANLIAWSIPPIKKAENKIMSEGIAGYTWHDANFGLIKFALLTGPVCIILAVISLFKF